MKIKVPAGTLVDLDKRRRTSSKGGVYDISDLSKEDQQRLLKTEGVQEVKDSGSSSSTKKKGD